MLEIEVIAQPIGNLLFHKHAVVMDEHRNVVAHICVKEDSDKAVTIEVPVVEERVVVKETK